MMERSNRERPTDMTPQQRLLAIIEEMARELQPDRTAPRSPSLQSRLDRDLGLDSLARSELLLRIEHAFDVKLPEEALMAETPAALLDALQSARGKAAKADAAADPVVETAHEPAATPTTPLEPVEGEPESAETLNAAMDWHLERHPDRPHLFIYGDDDQPRTLSYGELDRGGRDIAAALLARGVEAGDRVALMLPTSPDYFIAFLGILRAGAVPVPIYPPARPAQLEEHLRRHGRILTNAGAEVLITVPEARRVAHLLRADAPHLGSIVTVAELCDGRDTAAAMTPEGSSLALLQYTSGSTGDPKGVMLTHAQLLANIRAMGKRLEATPEDVFVSWLPLYHDMGLIAAWLASLYYAIPLVVMSPLSFLSHPLRWLELIQRHRGTIAGSPNFGYELCLRAARPEQLEALDLSSWRIAFNGAEPVSARTFERFAETLAPCGLHQEALMPVYGLAEAAVGLCVATPGRGVILDAVHREVFATTGEARPEPDPEAAQTFVNCGPPLPGYSVRIVDPQGEVLPERHEGDIEFRGPSATQGYFNNAEESRKLCHGEWLRTGDRGYLADGDIHLSGRRKDVLVRGGRNIYPYDLEEAIGGLEGVRKGCVAVFGNPNAESGIEELVVVAETHVDDAEERDAITREITSVTVDIVNLPPDDIRLVPPHSVLKTSSGKIRRGATAERYRSGQLEKGQAPVWRQVTGLALRSALQRWRHGASRAGEWLYAGYAWAIFGIAMALVALLALPLPRLAWRWRVAHYIARSASLLTGIRTRAHGLARFPHREPCVLVANHASYLDALILTAVFPYGFHYLAKAELSQPFLTRFVLQRMGVLFVERDNTREANHTTEKVLQTVRQGGSPAFFPEGTFRPEPGVQDFHMGAFVSAAKAQVAVVPVAIRGSRVLLRGREWLPHPGTVDVVVGAPLQPRSSDWSEAVRLRNEARAFIVAESGEPDLGASRA
ncbi:AMP-binding protein [Halomonas chromatireducens]|nr:AMP-binding protein [Halomonas chromatireducens]